MIDGFTKVIAHVGYPTDTFKSPLVYNPYFESIGLNVVVVPLGVKAEDYAAIFRNLFRMTNVESAIITMPHKATTVGLLDDMSNAVRICGACNAVVRRPDGTLYGEIFDGEGFVRGAARKIGSLTGKSALMIGSGGVGSAIAASLAAAGVQKLALFDPDFAKMTQLAGRLQSYHPSLAVTTGSNDPVGFDIVVNASPLGMNEGDPLPIDISRLSSRTFVGEVVLKQEITPFLAAAQARGCQIQSGSDMLFEQIPTYLEFFGLPTTTLDNLRAVAKVTY